LEPLSVALAAVTRAELRLGMSTLICGAGPIGLVTLLCAAAAGCEPLIITDLDQGRLDWATKLVPRVHTVLVSRDDTPHEVAEKIKVYGGSEGIVCAMECTGVESSVSTAIYVLPSSPVAYICPSLFDSAVWFLSLVWVANSKTCRLCISLSTRSISSFCTDTAIPGQRQFDWFRRG